ncbi:troponin I, skeletal, slow 1 [Rattus norvegicus]|uniref:Troponin I, skeletal, slow 1 n=1 Tax=Rattus norvegicus TaxID=10116 RepID=A6ICG5_RAT|nr:troponin I, skeletal, slow 1 [Rattus norvegicus]
MPPQHERDQGPEAEGAGPPWEVQASTPAPGPCLSRRHAPSPTGFQTQGVHGSAGQPQVCEERRHRKGAASGGGRLEEERGGHVWHGRPQEDVRCCQVPNLAVEVGLLNGTLGHALVPFQPHSPILLPMPGALPPSSSTMPTFEARMSAHRGEERRWCLRPHSGSVGLQYPPGMLGLSRHPKGP